MKGTNKKRWILFAVLVLIASYVFWPHSHFPATQAAPDIAITPYQDLSEWPKINQKPPNPELEQRIQALLKQMTLQEKVAQMVQAEITHFKPEQMLDYPLGSILNGGNAWPTGTPAVKLEERLQVADDYWLASQRTPLKIPLIWGTDAVHGHNNVAGATLFPHNLALGATADATLVEAISAATAQQVIATGLDWTFAPTLAVVQNPRWGRTYESFSQDGRLVYALAKAAVEGYQGSSPDQGIVATAKHYIGDGATRAGVDQGNARINETQLRNVHGQGYFAALEADVQTVMVSYSRWKGDLMHANHYLITDVLKQQMGFDGFVISDYNGHEHIKGCGLDHCAIAINAGIDMFMVPTMWRPFIDKTVAEVKQGLIPESRIDDAVSRILRVKMRAGLFDKPMPSQREGAGDAELLNSAALNALARKAVQQSLVLLKNNNQTLPLAADGNYLLLGDADSIDRQTGGWSINWQGRGQDNEIFGNANSILDGFQEILDAHNGVLLRTNSSNFDSLKASDLDGIVVVISERSYAEMFGDIVSWTSTDAAQQTAFKGLAELQLAEQYFPEVPLTTVFVGGRPLWLNPQLNKTDAFVMAWLPGTQGAGVADGLFGVSPINGRLPLNWPADDCTRNTASPRSALFPMGYGLTFNDEVHIGRIRPKAASRTIGTNGLALDCGFSNGFAPPLGYN